jgi:hypothetical protein
MYAPPKDPTFIPDYNAVPTSLGGGGSAGFTISPAGTIITPGLKSQKVVPSKEIHNTVPLGPSKGEPEYSPPPPEPTSTIEYFSTTDPADPDHYLSSTDSLTSDIPAKTKVVLSNPWVLFLILVGMYFAFYLWGLTLYELLKVKVFKGEPSWKQLLFYSAGITIVFVLIGWFFQIPTITLEKL